MDKLHVVKVGGTILNDEGLLSSFLDACANLKGHKILIHGGGRKASHIAKELGIETQMIDGRRITDAATLDVVVMVYAGLINKSIVAQLQAKDINALGLSGADMNILKSHKRVHAHIDYGFVGDIDQVDGARLADLISLGITTVICPITHNKQGQLLNTNADTIASYVARSMSDTFDVVLKYCFEYPGVMMDITKENSVIDKLDKNLYEDLKSKGKIHSGMLPKLDNAFAALDQGVSEVAVCGIDNLITERNLTWIK